MKVIVLLIFCLTTAALNLNAGSSCLLCDPVCTGDARVKEDCLWCMKQLCPQPLKRTPKEPEQIKDQETVKAEKPDDKTVYLNKVADIMQDAVNMPGGCHNPAAVNEIKAANRCIDMLKEQSVQADTKCRAVSGSDTSTLAVCSDWKTQLAKLSCKFQQKKELLLKNKRLEVPAQAPVKQHVLGEKTAKAEKRGKENVKTPRIKISGGTRHPLKKKTDGIQNVKDLKNCKKRQYNLCMTTAPAPGTKKYKDYQAGCMKQASARCKDKKR